MNLFDQLVAEALKNQPNLSTLRIAVEKELLHHDILRVLSQSNLLSNLTFIGGTCLRTCYGGIRLSEDLDFTGGSDFTPESLSDMSQKLIDNLNDKYGLVIKVTEPTKETGNVDTWKISIETRPQQKHLPMQRINIDICSVPSYEKQPMFLLNPYGVDMGTGGLVIQAQSREEIFLDKLLAFAFRPNRIKNRDLWDIVWLHQKKIEPKLELVTLKLQDRNLNIEQFLTLFKERTEALTTNNKLSSEFNKEMHRFLPSEQIKQVDNPNYWNSIVFLMKDFYNRLSRKGNE